MCNFPSETPTVLFLVLRSFLKSSMLQSLLLLTAICSPALSCFHDVVETERGQPPCCYLVKYAATVGHKIEFGSKTFVLHPNELYFTTRPKNMGKKPARIFFGFWIFFGNLVHCVPLLGKVCWSTYVSLLLMITTASNQFYTLKKNWTRLGLLHKIFF